VAVGAGCNLKLSGRTCNTAKHRIASSPSYIYVTCYASC
jgi:hypothetical protein